MLTARIFSRKNCSSRGKRKRRSEAEEKTTVSGKSWVRIHKFAYEKAATLEGQPDLVVK